MTYLSRHIGSTNNYGRERGGLRLSEWVGFGLMSKSATKVLWMVLIVGAAYVVSGIVVFFGYNLLDLLHLIDGAKGERFFRALSDFLPIGE
jgi:hypothetical protein